MVNDDRDLIERAEHAIKTSAGLQVKVERVIAETEARLRAFLERKRRVVVSVAALERDGRGAACG
jgi:hypothetical protein